MNRRRFDAEEVGGLDHRALENAEALDRYATVMTEPPAPELADRVRAAVASAPPPRKRWLAFLAAPFTAAAGPRMRAVAVVAVAALAVVSVMLAGQLGSALRFWNLGASPAPSPIVEPSPTTSAIPDPTVEPSARSSPSPSASPSGSAAPTAASPSVAPSAGLETPRPSETPRPTETPKPTGSGNSGPGGGGGSGHGGGSGG
jgi:uncharacterized membrane protein YgcG